MQIVVNTYRISVAAFAAQLSTHCTSVRRNRRCHKRTGAWLQKIASYIPNSKPKTTNRLLVKTFVFFMLILPYSSYAQQNGSLATPRKFNIYFQHAVGDKPLQQDTIYRDPSGEPFSVRSFKYYVSNLVLQNDATGEEETFFNDHFLVDEADTASKKIELITSLPQITSIHFLLGIDSIKNTTGVQTGDLDPAKGMFWTWNTGYIMAKLEGNSSVAKTPGHTFSYHVGGYKKNESTERQIDLMLPKPVDTNNDKGITVKANIINWFGDLHIIKIADTPICHAPGILATVLANNYASMFSIIETK